MPVGPGGIWVPDMNPRQFDVFNCQLQFMLMSGPVLSGKCLHADTLIVADGRMRRLGTIGAGLTEGTSAPLGICVSAMSETGFTQAQTSAVYRDACVDGLEMRTENGYSIGCSTWHPVWSFSGGRFGYRTSTEILDLIRAGSSVWVPLKRGCDGWTSSNYITVEFATRNKEHVKVAAIHDRIAEAFGVLGDAPWHDIARRANSSYHTVKKFSNRRFTLPRFSVTINEDVGYLLGLLVGDGCMSKAALRQGPVHFCAPEPDLIKSVKRLSAQYFDATFHMAEKCSLLLKSRKLKDWIFSLGLDQYSKDRFIPDCIVESPKTVVRAFLQGLFDTDGCAEKKGHVTFCSASKALAHDVHGLLLAFGIQASLWFKPNAFAGGWNIAIYGDEADRFYADIGFRLARKQNRHYAVVRHKTQERGMDYPPEIRAEIKRVYLSRHSRGAPRGNIPRQNKHAGYDHLYGHGGASVSVDKLQKVMAFSCAESDPVLNQYFLGGCVFWKPVASVKQCPVDLYDLTVPTHHNFIANGFINHNTYGGLHKIVRHLWELNGSRVAMFARTAKTAAEGGSYTILLDTIVPEWLNANLVSPHGAHFDYTIKPKCDNATRTHKFAIRNYWGTTSEFYLFSLQHDREVEEKVKNLAFSMIYFIELSNFEDRRVFDITILRLRMTPKIPFGKHQWIGDTNPGDDGEDSWIYQLFYEKDAGAKMAKDEFGDTITDLSSFRDQVKVVEFTIADNPKLPPEQVDRAKQAYAHDPDLYDRYILGKWKKATGRGVFGDVFLPETHVQGDINFADRALWQIIVPTEQTFELFTGWDLGDTNHSAHIAQKRFAAGFSVYDFIDELVCIKERISVSDFAEAFAEKMDYWEGLLKDMYGRTSVLWRHWSDSTALEYRGVADCNEHKMVFAASAGRISLQSIAKPRGSVKKRVDLVRRLLFEQRLFFSAQLMQTLTMMKGLRRARSGIAYLRKDDPMKHPFDSMSYLLSGEEPLEIESRMPGVSNPKGRLISVPA